MLFPTLRLKEIPDSYTFYHALLSTDYRPEQRVLSVRSGTQY